MSKMPWVRFFPSDWLGGTRGMTDAETGIYITLISTMYERGEPIVEDYSRLARLCGSSSGAAFKKALDTLVDQGKIIRSAAGLWNDRVEKEQVYISEKSEVGSRAANARWQRKGNKTKRAVDANAMPTQCEGNANQKPEARSHIDSSSSLRSEEQPRVLDPQILESKLREAAGDKIQPHGAIVVGAVMELINAGADLDLDVLPSVRASAARLTRPARSWAYFVPAIQEAHDRRKAAGNWDRVQRPPDDAPRMTAHQQRHQAAWDAIEKYRAAAPPMTAHQQRQQAAKDAFKRFRGSPRAEEFAEQTIDLDQRDFGPSEEALP